MNSRPSRIRLVLTKDTKGMPDYELAIVQGLPVVRKVEKGKL